MNEDPTATFVGGGPAIADVAPAGGVGWLPPGQTAWRDADLQAGISIARCFVFDPETGMPPAMLGKVDVFTVGDGGVPTAHNAGWMATTRGRRR
jgi:hypothetical protein